MAPRRPKVRKCPVCNGTGVVPATVYVGRGSKRRAVGKQDGMCLACFGTCVESIAKRA
ncbi:hypothetical protein [Streptomyces sp. SID3343]|uniref:hypothetical protein n=1 Tax=Streptomyces sp. SID3343 TaxID=2690260 RepID=UPI001928656B|nr:hypothetical protein [Streptomyces sp. SID3343]